jgi:hypothetical protein
MTGLHSDQANPQRAEQAFSFLSDLGFRIVERWISGGSSFKDGWRLRYASPVVSVEVRNLDMQLEVLFTRGGVTADYLFIDREILGRRSGLHGSMFPADKLETVIPQVAEAIRQELGALLAGEKSEWARIQRLISAPVTKSRLP